MEDLVIKEILCSHFCQKGVCSPMYTGHFTFYDPSQYLFSFPSNRPKTKKFTFFTNSLCHPQFFLAACCALFFDATDLPHSPFELLSPKLSMS